MPKRFLRHVHGFLVSAPHRNVGSESLSRADRKRRQLNQSIASNQWIVEGLGYAGSAGSVDGALLALDPLVPRLGLDSSVSSLRIMVRMLFVPDADGVAAVLHAARAGHARLVQFCLSLTVLARFLTVACYKKAPAQRDVDEALTLQEWFNHPKYAPPGSWFGEAKIISSLIGTPNASIYRIITEKRFDIREIIEHVSSAMNCGTKPHRGRAPSFKSEELILASIDRAETVIRQAELGWCGPPAAAVTSRKKGTERPQLNMGDVMDTLYEDPGSGDLDTCSDEDEEECTTDGDGSAFQTLNDGGSSKHDDKVPAENVSIEGGSQFTGWDDELSLFDDLSEIDTQVITASECGDLECVSGADWEVLSEVRSVKSVGSLASGAPSVGILSYRDALMRSQEPSPGLSLERGGQTKKSSVRAEPAGKKAQDSHALNTGGCKEEMGEDDPFLACFFEWDAYKTSRGGRRADLFKGNARIAKPNKDRGLHSDEHRRVEVAKRSLRAQLKKSSRQGVVLI